MVTWSIRMAIPRIAKLVSNISGLNKNPSPQKYDDVTIQLV